MPGAFDYEAGSALSRPIAARRGAQPLTMFYTSGTTGAPKGVRRPAPTAAANGRLDRLRRDIFGIVPNIRSAIPGPLYHSAPNAFAMRAGRVGDLMVLMPRFDPVALLELIERERIDTMFMVPTMFVRLLKLPDAVQAPLRCLLAQVHNPRRGAMPARRQASDDRLVGTGHPRVLRLHRVERGDVCHQRRHAGQARHRRDAPSTGAELRILDDDGKLLPAGEVGEIFTRFAALPDFTYHKKPEQRAASRARRVYHLGRRRLSRCRRLSVPVRPQARHGDLGRRQYLSGRDRGGAARACRASRTAPCSAFPTPSSARS